MNSGVQSTISQASSNGNLGGVGDFSMNNMGHLGDKKIEQIGVPEKSRRPTVYEYLMVAGAGVVFTGGLSMLTAIIELSVRKDEKCNWLIDSSSYDPSTDFDSSTCDKISNNTFIHTGAIMVSGAVIPPLVYYLYNKFYKKNSGDFSQSEITEATRLLSGKSLGSSGDDSYKNTSEIKQNLGNNLQDEAIDPISHDSSNNRGYDKKDESVVFNDNVPLNNENGKDAVIDVNDN
ncbi:hypothetical protein [Paraburkholderia bonniea]|uniref:hypothetical protein n=1 Tax=Paraburkholderia bonniea TaxID=2152891 RepID=UPI00129092E5|nr:hypothetical protein [Paraburkholderia bonniea]